MTITPWLTKYALPVVGIVLICAAIAGASGGRQGTDRSAQIDIPSTATLEGLPTVRVDTSERRRTLHVLDKSEAEQSRLTVKVREGRFFSGRDNRELTLATSGAFTYLSAEPGRYVRMRRVNDRISYVEHVDLAAGSVTYWGELRIVTGSR